LIYLSAKPKSTSPKPIYKSQDRIDNPIPVGTIKIFVNIVTFYLYRLSIDALSFNFTILESNKKKGCLAVLKH
jgi:hypothetical protein